MMSVLPFGLQMPFIRNRHPEVKPKDLINICKVLHYIQNDRICGITL